MFTCVDQGLYTPLNGGGAEGIGTSSCMEVSTKDFLKYKGQILAKWLSVH